MKNDTNAAPGRSDDGLDTRTCRHTGLSKPECHCQACLLALVSRFAPNRQG